MGGWESTKTSESDSLAGLHRVAVLMGHFTNTSLLVAFSRYCGDASIISAFVASSNQLPKVLPCGSKGSFDVRLMNGTA
jgi:hypothetical protein